MRTRQERPLTADIKATRQARAYRRAAETLNCAIVTVVQLRLGGRLTNATGAVWPITWRLRLDIEQVAYGHPSVTALDAAMLGTFPRLADSR